jgi:ankyrin repeat protein
MPDVRSFQDSVKKGNMEAIQATLAAQPDLLNQPNESGQRAYLLAKYYRQEAAADYLLRQGAELDFFDQCVAGQTEKVMAEIGSHPERLEARSSDGWTPLHLAAFFGYPALAEALLAKGAAVDCRSSNDMQNTPLHAAVAGRRKNMVQFLLEHGADANARQSGGWTALQGAAQNGDREAIEMLIANGAHVNARADNNQSALDLALMRGHQEIAELLEQLGAKL